MPDSTDPSRRDFLAAAGVGVISITALAQAQPLRAADDAALPIDHFVPEDKKLDPAWIAGLRARGERAWRDGEALARIGMPVGGIGCGQLYLRGDGTLTAWRIFNRPTGPQPPTEQGFALRIAHGGATVVKPLRSGGWQTVSFNGEHPLGTVRYADADTPVRVEMTAYSPFIPLDHEESGLPATVFEVKIDNTGPDAVRVALLGWLENAVGLNTASRIGLAGRRHTAVSTDRGRAIIAHRGEKVDLPAEAAPRPKMVVNDFEGADYGDWKTTGEAFGTGPAHGTLPNQQEVTGFLGKGLVNTYLGGDGPQGTLTSPPIKIERHYLNFLIGGGSHAGQTCMNLRVGGKVVRTGTGHDLEHLDWETWDIREYEGREAVIEIVDRSSDGWGHINVDQIEQDDMPKHGLLGPFDTVEDFGTLVLALDAPAAATVDTPPLQQPLVIGADTVFGLDERRVGATQTPATEIAPGASHTFTAVLAWHFPNTPHGQHYAERFPDAAAVAHHVLDNHAALSAATRLWHDTYYDSTLPYWLLERLHSTASYLATGTCQWWRNGRFWAWEGVACCEGTCTHVWNYAHASARLFPGIERIVRTMQDYGEGFDERTGLVGFRSNRSYAADGQCGTVLKAWREHQMSADDRFLKALWPRIRKSIEFLLGHDGNDDGLIEDAQPNTYDIDFWGPNTFVGALYLAALRAGEAMATEMGEADFAARLHKVAESGSALTVQRLFNGEYFIQDVDLKAHPKYQYGQGCLADQVFGQGWAHQVNLGYLYPADKVKSALRSIWRYNWAPSVAAQMKAHPPQRWFLKPDEPGLLLCTWPKSRHLGPNSVLYRDEVWTGIEYQVAGHMVWEDLLDEALVIVRTVHERYDKAPRNPFDEIECGDHYARAMASWGVFTALSGYAYHGPSGRLAFAPRLGSEHFKAAFTAAEGWGSYEQRRGAANLDATVSLAKGQLKLTRLTLDVPAGVGGATAKVGDNAVAATAEVRDGKLALTFAAPLTMVAGQTLTISAH
jgi:uncharacterized protein (DUF608 family)